ncbi:MAG: hypothetical protein FJ171_04845 [Gammaproteobacteria bacterium]|nr:hypothetical protein [Gammaproteobacteria bacterium]
MEGRDDEAPFPREPWQRLLGESGNRPPETTDARIRAAARRALTPRSRRWWLPASLAASVVLAVLIVRSEFDTVRRPVMTESAIPGDSAPVHKAAEPEHSVLTDAETGADVAPPVPRVGGPEHELRAASELAEEVVADTGLPASPSTQRELAAPPAAAAPAPSAAAAVASAESAEPESLSPETWYARIRKLFAEGRRAEAERELEALRRAYPAWAEKNVKADELR